jgi:hypothetical protein
VIITKEDLAIVAVAVDQSQTNYDAGSDCPIYEKNHFNLLDYQKRLKRAFKAQKQTKKASHKS